MKRQELKTRFWSKVDVKGPNECWPWKAGRSVWGYGRFGLNGGAVRAHRVAFELFYSRKPKEHVLHRCGNPSCVNPLHLYEGNDVDNLRDLYIDGGGSRKLSNENVREIRRLYKTGCYSQRGLGAKFECCQKSICNVLSGQTYSYVK